MCNDHTRTAVTSSRRRGDLVTHTPPIMTTHGVAQQSDRLVAMWNPLRPAPGNVGFFSSAKSLVLPRGPAAEPGSVRGYPIDFRVKAHSPSWPPDGMRSVPDGYVWLAQYGLGCYERYLAGEGERWFANTLRIGRYLVERQEPDGSWLNRYALRHTFPLKAPWRSAMAQGEAASLLAKTLLGDRGAAIR